jgi:hypothetical protein
MRSPTPDQQQSVGTNMINNFQDFQKLGQTNVDTAMKMFGDWNKVWQAIAS